MKIPSAGLAKIPLLHKLVGGGAGAGMGILLIGRFFGWGAALVLLIGILVIVGLLYGLKMIVKWREKKKGEAFSDELSAQEKQPTVSKAEIRRALQELGQQWAAAVEELRRSGLSLYSMPWYLLFGEPQSGKSTTLRNSSLEFPVGTEALSGAGGTRNCDWWFTNEAVVLDTAGRFSFQEKNAPDQDEWRTFLGLLKKHRRNCPINGVIVVVPCTSLLGDTPDQIEEKAQNIREKLTEVQRLLDIRFPVFLLITKCDVILGFTEFYTKLDAGERRQMMGWSNPGRFDEEFDQRRFPEVFENLCAKVHQLRMRFLCDEISTREVDKLFVFPEEFRSLGGPLLTYIDTMFSQTRYTQPPFFRGLYFTSGIQQGRPIARACADLLRSRGDATEEVVENLEDIFQTSRAFFIRDFYREKVFREQNLVVRSESALKRNKLIRRVAWIGGGAIAAVSIAMVVWGMVNINTVIGSVRGDAQKAEEIVGQRAPDDELSAESLELAEGLSDSQKRIPRVWVPLVKGRGNLVEDLGDIHQALYQNNILVPVVRIAESRLKRRTARPADEFEPAFREYLRWWIEGLRPAKKRDFSDMTIEPLAKLAKVDPGLEATLAAEFKDFVKQDEGDPSTALARRAMEDIILKGLDNYERLWDITEMVKWWEGLVQEVEGADEAYRDILDLRRQRSGRSDIIVDDFREYAQKFQDHLRRIEEKNAELEEGSAQLRRAAQTLNELKEETTDAYDGLIALADVGSDDADDDGIGRLVSELKRQKKEVLDKIDEDYKKSVHEPLDQYPHIIAVVGLSQEPPPPEEDETEEDFEDEEPEPSEKAGVSARLTQQARDVAELLKSFDSFVEDAETPGDDSDFTEWGRDIARALADNESRALQHKWHEGQEQDKELALDGVRDFAESEIHERWDAEDFLEAMKAVGRAGVVEWDIAALRKYASGLGGYYRDLGKERSREGYIPRIYRLDFCKETILDGSAVRDLIPEDVAASHPRAREILGELDRARLDYLSKYVKFWKGVYEGFDFDEPPQQELFTAKTWDDFQGNAVFVREDGTDLFDPAGWPLSDLLDNAAPRNLERIMESIPDARGNVALNSAFEGIRKPLEAYEDPKVQDRLYVACEKFVQCVSKLDSNPAEAWKELGEKDGDDVISWENMRALSEFENYLEKASRARLRKEVFARKLSAVEERGVRLLCEGTQKIFDEKWKGIMSQHESRLGGKFPFSRPKLDQRSSGLVRIVTCDLNDVRDFFRGQRGIAQMIRDFNLSPMLSGKEERYDLLGEKRKLFTVNCWKLEAFLFDEDDMRRQTVKVDYDQPAAGSIGSEYTLFRLSAPPRIDIEFRPRSDIRRTVKFDWTPESDEGRPLKIYAINEESGESRAVTYECDSMSLLAFVMAKGSRDSSDDRVFRVPVELPHPRTGDKLRAELKFTFEHKVPDLPLWTTAAR